MNPKSPRMPPIDRAEHEQLLHAAATAGDARAWQALYDNSYDRLARYVFWRLGGRRSLAEEVIQETWLSAVRLVDRFDPARGSFLQWLRGIAANVVRNCVRHEARRASVSGVGDVADESNGDTAERITLALAELPEHYEQILIAKYVDGESVAAIAAARGQTTKAIESLLTRAREAFRIAYGRTSQQDAPSIRTPTGDA